MLVAFSKGLRETGRGTGWVFRRPVDVESLCGAGYRERSEERKNSRNGYRTRPWDTRVGTIPLQIPKLREGSYFPDWLLQSRRRAERALISVVAECYVRGVSTRRVEGLVQTLGIERLSKSQVSEMSKSLDELVEDFRNRPLEGSYPFLSLDATVLKSREGGRVVNVSGVVAVGVHEDGYREILGLDVVTTDGARSTPGLNLTQRHVYENLTHTLRNRPIGYLGPAAATGDI